MQNSELIDRILFNVGNRSSYRAEVLATAKGWVKTKEQGPVLPWFLEKESSGLVTVDAQDYITLPADFLREFDEGVVLVTDSEGTEHKVGKSPSMARLLKDPEETGLPEAYFLFQGKMFLRPIPDDAYNLRFFYFQKSTVLTDDTTTTSFWGLEAEDALVYGAGSLFAAGPLRDRVRAAELAKLEKDALMSLWIAHEARIHSGQEYYIED